jgi:hypothetical protein
MCRWFAFAKNRDMFAEKREAGLTILAPFDRASLKSQTPSVKMALAIFVAQVIGSKRE